MPLKNKKIIKKMILLHWLYLNFILNLEYYKHEVSIIDLKTSVTYPSNTKYNKQTLPIEANIILIQYHK